MAFKKNKSKSKSKKVTLNSTLLVIVLIALLAIIGLLIYRDYYIPSQPVEIRYLESEAGIGEIEMISGNIINKEFDYIAIEFDPEISVSKIEEIFEEQGFTNDNPEEPEYQLAFSDQEDYDHWYRIKIPILKNPGEFAEVFKEYEEVVFAQAVFFE